MQTNQGLYLVLEGIDGSGKSTQIPLLQKYLQDRGYPVLLVREPYDTEIAADLFKYVVNAHNIGPYTRALLMMACRYDIQEKKIRPALEKGYIVISDRSFLSMLAYQLMYLEEVDHQQLTRFVEMASFVVRKPDRIFLFDLPVSVALDRGESPPPVPVGYSNVTYLEAVRQAYHRIVNWGLVDNIIPVDALRNREAVLDQLVQVVDGDVARYVTRTVRHQARIL